MTNPWRILRTAALQYGQALSIELSYRAAFLQTIISELVGMLGVLMFWVAVGKTATNSHGYTTGILVAYFAFAAALSMLSDDGLAQNLSMDIRTGKLSASLLRPHPFLFLVVSRSLAFVTVRIAVIAPLAALILFLVPDVGSHFRSMSIDKALLTVLAVVLALVSGWTVKSIVGLLAFRLTQTWGPELIYLSLFSIASGERYPPDVLSPFLLNLVSWSPFYYMIGFPTLVLTGRIPEAAILPGLYRGTAVASGCAVIAFWLWRRGLRRFEAVGI